MMPEIQRQHCVKTLAERAAEKILTADRPRGYLPQWPPPQTDPLIWSYLTATLYILLYNLTGSLLNGRFYVWLTRDRPLSY